MATAHKLVAGTFTTTRNPIIGVENDGEGSGAKVTIRDLTIVGNADTGHGINSLEPGDPAKAAPPSLWSR